jgi:hypothetical protein
MEMKMETAMLGQTIDETAAAHFMLDSHHLALLDRFVARARRQAQRGGRQFTGVMLQIDSSRPISVHAPELEPLELGLEPCIAGETARYDRGRADLRAVTSAPC